MGEIQPTQEQTSHYVYRYVRILLLPYFLFFFVFRSTPSLVRPLRHNHPFLFPIRKSDVCSKLKKVVFRYLLWVIVELAHVWDIQFELTGSMVGDGSEVDEVSESPSHSFC